MSESADTRPPQVLSISPTTVDDVLPAVSIAPLPDAMIDAPALAGMATAATPPAEDTRETGQWVQTLLALGLALVIVITIACAALLAVAHTRDRFGINIASGSWTALAWCANHGELYPPLRDAAGNFAGTRYMPLYILGHAGLARITGEYLFSGRMLAYVATFLWLAAIVALARRRGGSALFAAALASSVLLSPAGIQALCSIRSDGLALAMQLWALWIVSRCGNTQTLKRRNAETSSDADGSEDLGRLGVSAILRFPLAAAVFAGLLCALGFLAKLTAVWAAVAIGLWLLWRDRRALLAFVVSGLVIAGSALLILHAITDGRMLDNFLGVRSIGWSGWGSVVFWSPQRMLEFISAWSPTTWVLAPAAALTVLLACARREIDVLHLAALACVALLLVMFADIGVGENHILELAAITAVLAGDLWRRAQSDVPSSRWSLAQMLLAIAVIWSSLAVLEQRLSHDVQNAILAVRENERSDNEDPHALDAILAGRTFLSDDPSLAVLQDRKPVVLDAFMFRGFEEVHPEWPAELADRVARREFDVIVLLQKADHATWWYYKLFMGARVIRAIADHYDLHSEVAGYKVYERAASPSRP